MHLAPRPALTRVVCTHRGATVPDAAAVNEGAVPHIDDMWQGVVRAECKVALRSALQLYMNAMDAVREQLPQEEAVRAPSLRRRPRDAPTPRYSRAV